MRHRVAVLALDEVIAFDLGVPSQIFHSARDAALRRLYDVRIVTVDGARTQLGRIHHHAGPRPRAA